MCVGSSFIIIIVVFAILGVQSANRDQGRSPPTSTVEWSVIDDDLTTSRWRRDGIRTHDDDDDERPRLLNHHVRGVRQRAHHDQAHRD